MAIEPTSNRIQPANARFGARRIAVLDWSMGQVPMRAMHEAALCGRP